MTRSGTAGESAVLKILFDRGTITKDMYEGVLHRQQAYGGHVEEILLELGTIDEQTLLATLAAEYKTKYLLLEKLRDARFGSDVLKSIPEKVVRKNHVFPIAFDAKTRTISAITADPGDVETVQEIEKASSARKVVTYLARPAAVSAAIARWYDGDEHAFALIDREDAHAFQDMMEVYERHIMDESSIAAAAVTAGREESVFSAEDLERRAVSAPSGVGAGADPFATGESFLGALHIMMGLLEKDRGELRGHSIQVSRLMRQMAERIRLSPGESIALGIAGAIHDLGKFGLYHLTALNVAEWQGHWEAAATRLSVPTRLFESIQLPLSTGQALEQMYERYDGSGFPSGLKSKDISLGARILAIADTYSDITSNPKNSFRRVLVAEEAIMVLDRHREKIFDPLLLDVFKTLVAGGALRDSLLAGQHSILIVDADPEQAIILELNLASKGFAVEVCSNTRAGIQSLLAKRIDLLVAEVDLKPTDGFDLVQRIRADDRLKDIPVIFFTQRADQKDVARGFELGALDYVVKPSSIEVLVAKIQRGLQAAASRTAPAAAGGVSGSLKEMDLPDLVQVLSQGRKSGALRIASSLGSGEIHFLDGKVVNAIYRNREGEEAFYDLLHVTDGRFQVDPAFRPERILLKMSAESLLLEGMRRLDESAR